jgi:acetyl-CoA carboxylase carboxyl transferase alpha subunit
MKNAIETVAKSREKGRISPSDLIKNVFTDFFEMHGDKKFADDPAVIGGVGYLLDRPVTVIGINKGGDTKERLKCNFGSPSPEGYRKALRLMKQAEKFCRPIICIIDTPGAYPGIGAEERGQGQAIAENLTEMSTLKVPIISLFTGEGGSGGALALAVSDEVWMLTNAIYSVISPEGCASILWKDPKKTAEAAECLKLTSADLKGFKIIDKVIDENDENLVQTIKTELKKKLEKLSKYGADEIVKNRYEKFRRIGIKNV